MKSIVSFWCKLSLVRRILIGMIVGIFLSIVYPGHEWIGIFGGLFVSALKGFAPVLVLLLVISSLALHKKNEDSKVGRVVALYLVSMVLSGSLAVIVSFIFKPSVVFNSLAVHSTPPEGLSEVVYNLILSFVKNPVVSVSEGNFIGILAAAILFGIAVNKATDTTKTVFKDIGDAMCQVIAWIVSFAPLGVMGLVYSSINAGGFQSLKVYGYLVLVLVGTMAASALIINPLIVFWQTGKNPYPLVMRCLKDSGIPAFFTRSSAANIPVNMELCKNLGLDSATYSVSIPLGATINMSGASITITVLTLAAVQTLGIQVSWASALLMCIVATLSACGTSGVAGGSLLLIPLACSMFGIPADAAMQVVGAGFVISVIQDSCETALNSSSDVLFTAAAELGGKASGAGGETANVSEENAAEQIIGEISAATSADSQNGKTDKE
ncbi:serine/threonine transporter SstT [bacterium]|nr:serine/threonine transporter SstT [bacterium]